MTAEGATSSHQLKITIEGTVPPIWRRLLVPSASTLGQLHQIIQVAFGWENYHLHQFTIGEDSYTDPTMMGDLGNLDEEEVTLAEVAPRIGLRFVYEYDFGDSWRHVILVEPPTANAPSAPYPVCTDGEYAGPPEDCGGVPGYEVLCDAIADPAHPQHEHWREWLGDDFDPDAFDRDEINAELRQIATARIDAALTPARLRAPPLSLPRRGASLLA